MIPFAFAEGLGGLDGPPHLLRLLPRLGFKSERGPYSFVGDAAFNKRRGGGVESQDQAKAHLPDDGVIVVVDFPKVLRVALLLYVVNSTLDVEVKPSLGMEFPFTSGRATVCSSPSPLGASQADKLELSEHMQRRC